MHFYAPAEGALSDDARLTSVCLTSVAYIGNEPSELSQWPLVVMMTAL